MATAIFIGTFDPLHGGHIGQLLRAHHAVPLTKVFILVDKNPVHKPNASNWQHRLKIATMTLDAFDLPFLYEVLPAESSLADEIVEPIDYKITGIDSLTENITDPSRWIFITRWPMIVLSIPGIEESTLTQAAQSAPDTLRKKLHYTYVNETKAPMMNYDFETKTFSTTRVHSTQLRAGESQKFVPPHVQEYIQTHNLYNS